MDNQNERGSAWWMFAIAAGAVAIVASLATGPIAWWSVATMIVLGVLAVVLVVSGIRALVRKP
ncbi:hypothetical protein [Microbacterium sp. SLBN-146]|uniref:hypothetical protein n=1 Tax=Microbacterium sp. SLBN-146 TaxID=2768457 RepID=UPI0011523D80|nr:hypothetical protein [Microbacterium sp. SLBN-146]TQJ30471.1 hypothetical protein FBY39_0923 [Microbacterium sp. SLBN-146]